MTATLSRMSMSAISINFLNHQAYIHIPLHLPYTDFCQQKSGTLSSPTFRQYQSNIFPLSTHTHFTDIFVPFFCHFCAILIYLNLYLLINSKIWLSVKFSSPFAPRYKSIKSFFSFSERLSIFNKYFISK